MPTLVKKSNLFVRRPNGLFNASLSNPPDPKCCCVGGCCEGYINLPDSQNEGATLLKATVIEPSTYILNGGTNILSIGSVINLIPTTPGWLSQTALDNNGSGRGLRGIFVSCGANPITNKTEFQVEWGTSHTPGDPACPLDDQIDPYDPDKPFRWTHILTQCDPFIAIFRWVFYNDVLCTGTAPACLLNCFDGDPVPQGNLTIKIEKVNP